MAERRERARLAHERDPHRVGLVPRTGEADLQRAERAAGEAVPDETHAPAAAGAEGADGLEAGEVGFRGGFHERTCPGGRPV